ncbi:ESX secretion-associated protein EspG [Umezawaea tangerina]|uniref:ESAT-6 protein secretion system EspG family protein n=1 Tax=Umezawaea tangerina TaxID=84725 RepID=A0A2T0T9Z1_9PSEU|nr:ESX secretion-associated protein EspG [Umezawaea tangerina]PRY42458.1 ESAT-6 protein secretion system EspG family protein [Umezawaea tangerina]
MLLAKHQKQLWRPISEDAFDVLWRYRYGQARPKPVVLECPSRGTTEAERREIERVAWDELAFAGFGRPNSLSPRVADALAMLLDADMELDLRAVSRGRTLRALAVAERDVGLLAVLSDGRYTLVGTSRWQLAQDLVALLPAHRPGNPKQRSVPVAVLAQADTALRTDRVRVADQPFTAVTAALAAAGCQGDATRACARLVEQPPLGRAELGGALRIRGERKRHNWFLTVHDTPTERYLVTHRVEDVTVVGATPEVIVAALQELVRSRAPW